MTLRPFMTFRSRRAGLCLAALFAAGIVRAADPLTLEQALDAALRNNLRLAESALAAQRDRLDVDLAKSARDARYTPFVQLADSDAGQPLAYGLQVVKPLAIGTTVGLTALERQGTDAPREGVLSLDLSQPLFRRFGRLVTDEPVHAAGDRLRASLRLWETRKANLAMTLVTLFETIARLETQADFEKRFIDQLDRLAALTRARERQGRATRVDSLRVEIRRGEAETRRANAQERRAIALRELAETIGADPREDLLLAPPPQLDSPLPESEAAIAIALSHRMEYAQILDDATTAARRNVLAGRNRWPDVLLSLSLRRAAEGTLTDAAQNGETRGYATVSSAGLAGTRADRITAAQADLDSQSARLSVEWTRQSLVRETLQALAECRRAEGELRIAERNRELAENSARASRRLYSLGRTDGLTAETAETQLAESENRLFEARSADRLSRYALRYTLGILIEHPDPLAPPPAGWSSP